MIRGSCIFVLVGAVAIGACTGSSPPPTPSTGSPATPETITGTEHLGWDQQAADSAALASILYAIYVDAARSQLAGTACATTQTTTGFACTAPLPVLSPGPHALALAAFIVTAAGMVLESPQTSPLQVVVVNGPSSQVSNASSASRSGPGQVSSASPSTSRSGHDGQVPSPWRTGSVVTTADHVQLRLDVVADGLEAPTDIAFAPDGRIFIAERAGRVRIVRDGQLQAEPALTLADVTAGGQGGLLSLALDPGFDHTGLVYALYTTLSRDQRPAFRLARFRAVRDTLGERAILLDDIDASPRAAAALRFGPDAKLYAAFDDGGYPAVAGDLSSFNGKILRMNADGSTPGDQAAATPVYSYEYHSPRGLDWQPATGTPWVVDGGARASARLSAAVAVGDRSKRGTVRPSYELPPPVDASALAFYRGGLIPAFRDNLLIAADEGRSLLRIRFDKQDATRIVATERLLQDRIGGLLVVASGPDGAIYLCTASALVRLTPAPA
jgi:glucose/arabinose dehydrogenase